MQTEELVGYKLSPQQRLVWRLTAGASVGLAGREGTVLRACARIDGDVAPQRLRDAVRACVERHEMLRTRLISSPNVAMPVQVVSDDANFAWRELSDGSGSEAGGGSGVTTDAPVAVTLRREGAGRSLLVLEIAATHADRASIEVLLRDLSMACAGTPWPDDPLQYADLATWLNETAETAGEGKDYWREAIELAGEDMRLAGERASSTPAEPPRFVVTPPLTLDGGAVSGLAARLGVTTEAVLLGCWQALLLRLTRARRLAVAVTMTGRSYEGMETAVGLMERQVPMVATVGDGQAVWQLLTAARTQLTEGANAQEYFRWEDAPRAGDHQAAACGFSYRQLPAAWSTGDGATWTVVSIDGEREPNKLALRCVESADASHIVSTVCYDETTFDEGDATTLLRQFAVMVSAAAAAGEEMRLDDVDLMTADERARLDAFNGFDVGSGAEREAAGLVGSRTDSDADANANADAEADTDVDSTVALFEAQAARTPGHVALSSDAGDLTYAELDRRASALAMRLIELGAAPEQAVGMSIARGPLLIVAMLAIWKAGAAYLPLDDCPAVRLRHTLANSGARIVVTERDQVSRFEDQEAQLLVLDDASESSGEPERRAPAAAAPLRPSGRGRGRTLAYIIYTSGSTGEPKGVMVEHRSLVNHMRWALRAFGLGERERVLMKTSVSFDASVWEWLLPLLQGGVLVLAAKGMQGDSHYLVRQLRERRITTLQLVPAMLRVLVEEPGLAHCPDLERVFAGGEALDAALVARFHEVTGRTLINLYGPTEATIDTTSLVMTPREGSAIGRPVLRTQVHVLRAEAVPRGGDPRAIIGEAGEIHIGGAALARGYVGRPEETAERFIPDPFGATPGARLYRTGDIGRYRANGVLEFIGRQDGQVKIRGHRIELGDVERAIYAQPGVAHAAVVVKTRAGGERQLAAYVEFTPETSNGHIVIERLRDEVRVRLAEYMCPSTYVRLAQFPRTASGKLDRQALPESGTSAASAEYTAPRTDNERILAEIWAAVLGVPRVSVSDNFFEIGGDSILGIQIVARARQAGMTLTPRQLFQHQTIAALAQAAESGGAASGDAAAGDAASVAHAVGEPPPEPGPLPLTPIQARFFGQAGLHVHHFNQAFLFTPLADLRVDLLDRALAALVAHHDTLRLRFEPPVGNDESTWRQRYISETAGVVNLARVDLRGSEDRQTTLRAAIEREQGSLNITDGPLLRATWFDLDASETGAREARVLIIVHHLAIDGVSWRILLEDLETAYTQLASGGSVSLPPRTTSYRRWAENLVAYSASAAVATERAYWLREAQAPVDAFPVDDASGRNTVADEEHVVRHLSAADTARLLTEAGKAYHTQVMDVLLAALIDALRRWRGISTLRAALEGHGREEVGAALDLSRTVGWFTSIYPVRLAWRDDEAPGDRLQRVKAQVRAIPRHGIGYGLLRHLRSDMAIECACPIVMNYLGQLDQSIGRGAWLPVAREGAGPPVAADLPRASELDVNAFVIDGQLQMTWTYSRHRLRRETAEALAAHYADALRDLVEHCTSRDAAASTRRDDFKWDASQINAVTAAIRKAR